MNRRTLVPYDGSEQSNEAFVHAVESFPDADIVLLHVIEPYTATADHTSVARTNYEQRRAQAEELLESAVETQGETDRVETAIAVGRPIHEILSATDEHGIDQIVLGSHGRDGAARLLLGSVAETVVRRAPVPVTVVRQEQAHESDPDRVLVPYDGSTAARHALEHALDRFESATVTALFVLYPPTTATDPAMNVEPTDGLEAWDETRHDHATEVLSGAVDIASGRDREIQTQKTGGEPAEGILSVLEEADVDHVVIGSTGRDGLTRLLLGSVAETVVRRSPVSVTVVK
jgi:nucleotide-binding universal stress UspA family protein